MAKKRKRKTLKQAYKEAGLPKSIGDKVNDFFFDFGIEGVEWDNGDSFKVTKPRKRKKTAKAKKRKAKK